MKLKSTLTIAAIATLIACNKNNDTAQPNPGYEPTDHPRRIVEVEPGNDSAVLEINFTAGGDIANGKAVYYNDGVAVAEGIFDCTYDGVGLLKSMYSTSENLATGERERNDVVCYTANGVITGLRSVDSSDKYTRYQKFEYNGSGQLVSKLPEMDSARFFNTPPDYDYKDSFVYQNQNLVKYISLRYDVLLNSYVESYHETITDYDDKPTYLPHSMASYILFDIERLLSANNAVAFSFQDVYGNARSINSFVSYDGKGRPTGFNFTGAGPLYNFYYGLFFAELKQVKITY